MTSVYDSQSLPLRAKVPPEGVVRGESWVRGPLGRMLGVWTLQEIKLLFREPVAVFFSLAFPVVIYIFIGIPYADQQVDGVRFADLMFPGLVGTVIANLLLMGLPIYLSELRFREVDKRYAAMPLPGWVFGVSVIGAMLVLVATASALIIALVATGSGLRAQLLDPRFILLLLGLVAILCPIGFFFGTLPFSPRTIQAATAAVFFILFFGSGAAVPIDGLPQWLQTVLEANPLKIWFDQLVSIYIGNGWGSGAVIKLGLTALVSLAALIFGLRNWRRVS